MKKPNERDIAATLARLKIQAPSLPPSAFGDDNCGACRAQIQVLSERMCEADIYDEWPSDIDETENPALQHKLDAALEARRWLDGDTRENPADGWEPIFKRATGRTTK